MLILVNGNYGRTVSSIKEANSFLQMLSQSIKKEYKKDINFTDLNCVEFANGIYVEKYNLDGLSLKVSILKDEVEAKKYFLSDISFSENEIRENISELLNMFAQNYKPKDENIYLVLNDNVVGKSINLDEINNYVKTYVLNNFLSNEHKTNNKHLDSFFVCDKNDINEFDLGYYNCFSFIDTKGLINVFSLVYPLEKFREGVQIKKEIGPNIENPALNAQIKILNEISNMKIKDISEKVIPIVEQTQTHEKEQQKYELLKQIHETNHEFHEYSKIFDQLITERKNLASKYEKTITKYNFYKSSDDLFYEIIDYINEKKDFPAIESSNVSTIEKNKLYKNAFKKIDGDIFVEYSLEYILKKYPFERELINSYSEYHKKEKAIDTKLEKVDKLRIKSYAKQKELEKEYKKIVPSFSIELMEQEKILSKGE